MLCGSEGAQVGERGCWSQAVRRGDAHSFGASVTRGRRYATRWRRQLRRIPVVDPQRALPKPRRSGGHGFGRRKPQRWRRRWAMGVGAITRGRCTPYLRGVAVTKSG